jgi:hypothetical protein
LLLIKFETRRSVCFKRSRLRNGTISQAHLPSATEEEPDRDRWEPAGPQLESRETATRCRRAEALELFQVVSAIRFLPPIHADRLAWIRRHLPRQSKIHAAIRQAAAIPVMVTTMVITTTWPLRSTPCCSRRCFLGASDFTIRSAEDPQGGILGYRASMPCRDVPRSRIGGMQTN